MLSKGIVFILIATFSFSIMNVMAKDLLDMHAMQVVFFRAFGSFVFIFPYMLYHRIPVLGTHRKLLFARALVGLISLSCFFLALQTIPLGSAISIRYLGPIFGAILAFFILKERINIWQWLSFAIAFSGVLVLKGFDFRIDAFSFWLVIISALFVGMVFNLLRYLADKEHHMTIINYFMVLCVIAGLFFVDSWRMPLAGEWVSVIGIGVFGLIGQIFMTQAFQTEETSVLAPFKYMELVYAMVMGYFMFGETYALIPILGIILIIGGMFLNLWAKGLKKINPSKHR